MALFRFNDERWLVSATYAESASYHGGYWLLQDVRKTFLSREGTRQERVDQERWDSGLTPEVLSVLVVKPENLPLGGLFTYARYLDQQGLTSAQYWKKVLMPVGTAVMVIVAISFIFGPLRSVTMGFRVFTGLIVGLLFKYMQDLLGPMSLVFGFDPILAILIPILINGAIGAWLMRRAG